MEKVKISLFSKVMAVLLIIFAVFLTVDYIYFGSTLWEYVIAIAFLAFATIISLSVLFSRFPRLLCFKIIFLIMAAILVLSIFDMLNVVVWQLYYYGLMGCLQLGERYYLLGILIALIGSIATYWTISVLVLNIFPIKRKIWIIGSICLFIIYNIAALLTSATPAQLKSEYDAAKLLSHETTAIAGLKQLVLAETTWHEQDPDKNGIKDYWTYDISCLHRMYQADGKTKINLIDIGFAAEDEAWAKNDIFGAGIIEPWTDAITEEGSPSLYSYRAMLTDEDGQLYNQNEVGENKTKATNSSKFAFVAYPYIIEEFGARIFIVNESGTIYATKKSGSNLDDKRIVLQWPGKDPTKVKGLGGEYWVIVK
jgi:hypothetical protein